MSEKLTGVFTTIISWLEKIMNLIDKYGFFKILKSLVVVILCVFVTLFASNPTWIFEKVDEYYKSIHDAAMDKRIKVDPLIRGELLELAAHTRADRVWIIEFHNGTTSFGGLPFRFGDMTYEQPACENALSYSNQNVPLSRYQFITNLYNNGFWYGDLEALKEEDISFYYKMKSEGVDYLAIMLIHGVKNPIGFLAVAYMEPTEIDERLIGRCIRNSSVKLCRWLDAETL